MNIALVLTQKFDPTAGGVQRTTSKLANIFHAKTHGIIIIVVGNHKTRQETFEALKLYYINVKEASNLQHVLKSENINCIINQMGYSVPLTKLLLKYKPLETKIINTLRINPLNFYENHANIIKGIFDSKKIGFLNTKITRAIILKYHVIKQNIELGFIVKNVDAFVMLSEKFKPELFFLAPPLKNFENKIFGIGNPFQRPEINLTELKKENIIIYVGRLNIQQKRVDLLLQIWKRLHAEAPDWKFWVLGDGEEQKKMEQYCKENNLDRITFFGKVDPTEYYKKAKIFHMTSAFEGFGNVLIEAQSYGCVPMLFDSYAAASDIIGHNQNGILIKALDTQQYADETIILMQNPLKLKELANNGFENVLRFSYEATYKNWETVFKSLN